MAEDDGAARAAEVEPGRTMRYVRAGVLAFGAGWAAYALALLSAGIATGLFSGSDRVLQLSLYSGFFSALLVFWATRAVYTALEAPAWTIAPLVLGPVTVAVWTSLFSGVAQSDYPRLVWPSLFFALASAVALATGALLGMRSRRRSIDRGDVQQASRGEAGPGPAADGAGGLSASSAASGSATPSRYIADLSAQRTELDELGYTIVSETDSEIVAVRIKWYWDVVMSGLPFVVLVQSVPTLTKERIRADAGRINAASRELIDLAPSKVPSFVASRDRRMVLALWAADTVEPAAAQALGEGVFLEGSGAFFPFALERSSGTLFYWKRSPLWGRVYAGKIRYHARRILDPATAPSKEPLSGCGIALLGYVALGLLFMAWLFVYLSLKGPG